MTMYMLGSLPLDSNWTLCLYEKERSPSGGTGDLLELLNDGESVAGVLLDVGIGVNLALGDG